MDNYSVSALVLAQLDINLQLDTNKPEATTISAMAATGGPDSADLVLVMVDPAMAEDMAEAATTWAQVTNKAQVTRKAPRLALELDVAGKTAHQN